MNNDYQEYTEDAGSEGGTDEQHEEGLDEAAPAPPPALKRATVPRAKYSPEFEARVAAQTAPRQARLVGGSVVPASSVLEALIATATPMKLVDRVLGLPDGDLEGWLVGGRTNMPDEIVGGVFMALYEIKSGKLEHLRGEDKELLLKLVISLTDVAPPAV